MIVEDACSFGSPRSPWSSRRWIYTKKDKKMLLENCSWSRWQSVEASLQVEDCNMTMDKA